ncbi:MAG: hypothetical protein OXG58_05300 [Gemmatimonadetes bacterium]|nr:hypothetical protein [Gemmatimonadota bacterium]MCY3944556.1 hypothetical protein [Gemmatimonadota bacterium]
MVSGTCFKDPEGETLTITGVSSNEEIVTVRVFGTYYQVRAISPGVTTIILRAEDPAGGAASVSVPVLVPNQPPIALGSIPRARMLIGGSSRSTIAGYFGDPDGQPLTFSAVSGDPDVVSAAIEDSTRLIIGGLTLGEATVTVVATDPGGLTASLDLGADVLEPELVFRDHMDADSGDWSFNANTRYRFGDGYLHMGNQYPYTLGSAERTVDVAEWQYSASMGIEEGGEQYTAGLWSYAPDSSTVERLWASIGYADTFHGQAPEANWRIFYYCCYTTEPGLFGNSEAVGSIGELTELVWTSRDGVMTLAAGETTLATVDLIERNWPNVMEVARLVTFGPDGSTDAIGLFDWTELWAIPVYQ